MALIKSISGIRGTIGGKPGENLSPVDIVKFSCAFARFLQKRNGTRPEGGPMRMVVGRAPPLSGPMVDDWVKGSLAGMGVDVIETGLSTTPTVEMAVRKHAAHGGIIITASHNPIQWNALKLLNEHGEFIDAAEGAEVIRLSEEMDFPFAAVEDIGHVSEDPDALSYHIRKIEELPLVDAGAVRKAKLKVVLDGINSTGSFAVPALLEKLGVEVQVIHDQPLGWFAHNPEPLPAHLADLSRIVVESRADMGISVDPDVDRLAFVCEDGSMFGEEYTLVAVADYVLAHVKGAAVSNLSSSRALRDVAEAHGCAYFPAAVGEVNVVAKMREVGAVIGGEGNGGVIYPPLHYGRDALVGIALFLSHFAHKRMASGTFSMTSFRAGFPAYSISKNRVELPTGTDVEKVLSMLKERYRNEKINEDDGVRIDFEASKEWVQIRKSNTEPIMRVYAESMDGKSADALGRRLVAEIDALMHS